MSFGTSPFGTTVFGTTVARAKKHSSIHFSINMYKIVFDVKTNCEDLDLDIKW